MNLRVVRVALVVVLLPACASLGDPPPTITPLPGAEARQRELIPLVGGKEAIDGVATAYVCEQRVCARSTSDPAVLAVQLAKVGTLSDP